jgi:hypothetical protein
MLNVAIAKSKAKGIGNLCIFPTAACESTFTSMKIPVKTAY